MSVKSIKTDYKNIQLRSLAPAEEIFKIFPLNRSDLQALAMFLVFRPTYPEHTAFVFELATRIV